MVHAWTTPVEDPTVRFQRTILQLTPRTFVTQALIAANVIVFVLMVLSGAGLMMPGIDQLLGWGANFGPRTLDGQWWRLLSCMFVHIGLVHLAFNMWVLWQIGQLVERLVGNTGFAVLYLVSGVGGSLASLLWHPDKVSAGASGAVFGLFGGLLGFVLLCRHTIPMRIFRSLLETTLSFVAFNIVIGMMIPAIDMAAHVGGLAAGFLCGVGLSQPVESESGRRRPLRNLLVALVGGGVLAGGFQFIPAPPAKNRADVPRLPPVAQAVSVSPPGLHPPDASGSGTSATRRRPASRPATGPPGSRRSAGIPPAHRPAAAPRGSASPSAVP